MCHTFSSDRCTSRSIPEKLHLNRPKSPFFRTYNYEPLEWTDLQKCKMIAGRSREEYKAVNFLFLLDHLKGLPCLSSCSGGDVQKLAIAVADVCEIIYLI